MSSPITLSGFNNVDFGLIVDAILEQERSAIRQLELDRTTQELRRTAFQDLGSKLSAFDSAVSTLSSTSAFQAFQATASDTSILSATAGEGAAEGSHTITVNALAQAQVLASTSTTPDTDTTAIADGGSITVGGQVYTAAGSTTLAALRDQINSDANGVANASLVDTGSGYRLVLTAKSTGLASAFTVENNLTLGGGASSVTFHDDDSDGSSGDSAADNSVQAADASLLVDNVAVTRSSNNVSEALAGVTLTLTNTGTTTLNVASDTEAVEGSIKSFVEAFNDFSGFLQQQFVGANGFAGPLTGDFVARTSSSEIRSVLRSSTATGSAFQSLAEIGILFERTGELSVDETRLREALTENPNDVRALFQDSGGILSKLETTLDVYIGSAGLLSSVEDRIDDTIGTLNARIFDMEERLVLRESELRQMFSAADQAISTLNAQMGSLASIAG